MSDEKKDLAKENKKEIETTNPPTPDLEKSENQKDTTTFAEQMEECEIVLRKHDNEFDLNVWTADDDFLPIRATDGSAAYDLKFNLESFNHETAYNTYKRGDTIVINPNGRAVFPCGFRMAIPVTVVADVRGRSGLAVREGLGLTNGLGTIDSDYRGEVGAILHNYSDTPIIIHNKERIAHMVFLPVLSVNKMNREFDLDTFLTNNNSSRGDGGFGHTGK